MKKPTKKKEKRVLDWVVYVKSDDGIVPYGFDSRSDAKVFEAEAKRNGAVCELGKAYSYK